VSAALFLQLLIGLAILALLLYTILGPREAWDLDQSQGLLTRLRRRRDRLLRALKDLDFERETGTLSEPEFHRLRADFRQRAVEALKDLDRARGARIRRLARGRRGLPPSVVKKVEQLVQERKEKR
jgi:hypothetical protein